MTDVVLGAGPTEWAHFVALGLTADMLPVVADTSLPLSPDSKLKTMGKLPSYVKHDGTVVGFGKWTQYVADEAAVRRWAKDSRLGICLQTREVRAIDIDVEDEALAQQLADTLELILGPLPWRMRAGSARRLALVRCPGELHKRSAKNGEHLIEFLATGQQCVVVSTHPSGQRYEWPAGLPETIPEASEAELLGAWDAIVAELGGDAQVEGASVVLDKPRRAADALPDPVTAYQDALGRVRGYGSDGRVFMECPMAAQHGADNGETETCWFPPGVGGRAEGGFECRHRSHGKIGTSLFLSLIGFAQASMADEFEVVSAPAAPVGIALEALEPGQVLWQPFVTDAPWPNFGQDKNGKIQCTNTKVVAALSRPDICEARIGYDAFKALTMIEWASEAGSWRPFRDTDYIRLKVALETRGFTKIPTDMVKEAVGRVAEIHEFDSAIQWVSGLKWDGVPRIERFFVDCFSVEDTPYSRAVGRYAWTALAGRALRPGCKADMTPVLIGGQGLRKTSGVQAMCPTTDAFVELALDIHDDNLARKIRGKLVGEIGELRGMAGKDGDAIKQWFSRTHEEWTPKYREYSVTFPRRLLMLGTGNNSEFLDDETGARRFLPMTVLGLVDTARIARERDQLWAEGRAAFCSAGHEVEWRDAEALAKEQHHQYTISDDWAPAVLDWLARDPMEGTESPTRGEGLIRVADVLTGAIGLQLARIGKREQMRMAKVLTNLGYVRDTKWLDGKVQKVWRKASQADCAEFA